MDVLLKSSPLEIYVACDKVFGGQPWLTYEPETLLHELREEVSDLAEDKLLAVKSLAANSSAVLHTAAAFEKVVLAFNNNVCVMDEWQPPYIEEICYAVKQMLLIMHKVHGQEATQVEFYGEIPGYVAAVAKHRDWFILPNILSFAQKRLDFLTGINKKSKKYREHKQIVDLVSSLYSSISEPDAEKLLNSPELAGFNGDDTASLAVKKIIGALVYDPTVIVQ